MDIHTAIAPTQQLLLWILFSFLCAWMITFAYLAAKKLPEVQAKEIAPSPHVVIPVTPAVTVHTQPLETLQVNPIEAEKQSEPLLSRAEIMLEQSILS